MGELNSLRQGGYILYVRHGEATLGVDQPSLVYSDCTTQRNLSKEGRREAVAYGEALRSLQIPDLSPVLASPFCRTRETAELAFGKGNVQLDPFWIRIYDLGNKLSPAEQEMTLTDLSAKLEKIPAARVNQIVVAHGFPQGVGLGEISNMGTVIIKPKGEGKGFEVVGRISLAEWVSS